MFHYLFLVGKNMSREIMSRFPRPCVQKQLNWATTASPTSSSNHARLPVVTIEYDILTVLSISHA